MRQFQCDYVAGCHPQVLKAIVESNDQEEPGYGDDTLTQKACELIRAATKNPKAAVYLFTGGTQVNLTVIGSILRPAEGVVATASGHIQAHETGAIEATGHRVIQLPSHDGKLSARDLAQCLTDFATNEERMLLVKPSMVYISQPTEWGTVYSEEEIKELAGICRKASIPLYIDGARLAYALAAEKKVNLPFLAKYADLFYIGGTKCGALAAEALVICNSVIAQDFVAQQRVRGALLAKGRFLGAQFCALFTKHLYEKIGEKAIAQAKEIKEAVKKAGIAQYVDSQSNQLFLLVTEKQAKKLSQTIRFENCGTAASGERIIRLCTAWSTSDAALQELLRAIASLAEKPAKKPRTAVNRPPKTAVGRVKKPTARKKTTGSSKKS